MIRIVIADDSYFFLKVLKEKIESSGKIQVVGAAKNGKEAIEVVRTVKPDLLILDCQMPVMDGLECLKRIKHQWPGPVFMLSSLTSEGAETTIRALEYGAVDFLQKPADEANGLNLVIGTLIEKIEVIVLQQRLKGIRQKFKPLEPAKDTVLSQIGSRARKVDLIAMGSSTGGIQAVLDILPQLPATMTPIAWVQHLPAAFSQSLAKRFDGLSQMRVKVAQDGEIMEQGVCYLAPGGMQMRVKKLRSEIKLCVGGEEKVSSCCPSCDVLFESVAEHLMDNAVGVILSGMGNDGAKGLQKMHQKGAFVIGQTEKSCVVYGMPKMAHEKGAVDVELDSKDIADGIQRVCGFCV